MRWKAEVPAIISRDDFEQVSHTDDQMLCVEVSMGCVLTIIVVRRRRRSWLLLDGRRDCLQLLPGC